MKDRKTTTKKPTPADTREAAIARCLANGIGDPTEEQIKEELANYGKSGR